MSRIGRMPISLPAGVQVEVQGRQVTVNGPNGSLTRELHPDVRVEVNDGKVQVSRSSDERELRALHGLTRALLNNMVVGVSKGFQKQLEVQGVGYRVEPQADGSLLLSLGFSHQVRIAPPAGIWFAVDPRTRVITVSGADKEMVGRVAAEVRAWRPPEPYKGKGVRYVGERVRHKAGKAGKTG